MMEQDAGFSYSCSPHLQQSPSATTSWHSGGNGHFKTDTVIDHDRDPITSPYRGPVSFYRSANPYFFPPRLANNMTHINIGWNRFEGYHPQRFHHPNTAYTHQNMYRSQHVGYSNHGANGYGMSYQMHSFRDSSFSQAIGQGMQNNMCGERVNSSQAHIKREPGDYQASCDERNISNIPGAAPLKMECETDTDYTVNLTGNTSNLYSIHQSMGDSNLMSTPEIRNESHSPPNGPSSYGEDKKASPPKLAKKYKKKNDFKCTVCKNTYRYRKLLRVHMDTHNQIKLKCTLCEKQFVEECDLLKHQSEIHPDRNNKCNVCKLGFKTKQFLWDHLSLHLQQEQKSPKNPKEITLSPHSNDAKTLSIEDERNSDQDDDQQANSSYKCESVKLVKCQYCWITFVTKTALDAHMLYKKKEKCQKHDSRKMMECSKCNKKYLGLENLKKHQNSSCIEHEIECQYCKKKYRGIDAVKSHQKNNCEHRTKHANYICEICGVAFSQLGSFEAHIAREHIKERKYKCDVCNHPFFTIGHLKSHQAATHALKRLKCEWCDKRFMHPNALHQHHNSHTGDKPYQCTICNKSFSRSRTLQSHRFVHASKVYKCSICEKAFSRKCTLTYHQRLHTGEKPCKCQVCGQTFSDPSSLSRHLSSKHKGKEK